MYSYHSRVNPNPRNAFTVLDEPSLQGLVGYMKSRKCRHVVLMLGAGISTSAGIPDFRSPRTGLYHNLAKLNLPFPEAVFDLSYFRENPQPFYTLAHELYPGKYNPTLTHAFIRVLDNHNLLHRCFTQNIDTLERRAGVPPSKIVEAHGSFASQRCIGCRRPFDDERMKRCVLNRIVPRCETCNSLVKPDIVFFGESLPLEFARAAREVPLADLLIIIGTSLTVNPFAALANMPSELCPRVLINLEQVGDLGFRPDDVLLLGKCDEVVHKLCRELGWENELAEVCREIGVTFTPLPDSQEDVPPSVPKVQPDLVASDEKPSAVASDAAEHMSERLAQQIAGDMAAAESGSHAVPVEPEESKVVLLEEVDKLAEDLAAGLTTSDSQEEVHCDVSSDSETDTGGLNSSDDYRPGSRRHLPSPRTESVVADSDSTAVDVDNQSPLPHYDEP